MSVATGAARPPGFLAGAGQAYGQVFALGVPNTVV